MKSNYTPKWFLYLSGILILSGACASFFVPSEWVTAIAISIIAIIFWIYSFMSAALGVIDVGETATSAIFRREQPIRFSCVLALLFAVSICTSCFAIWWLLDLLK